MINKEAIKMFLEELSILSKKYKIKISGCGCNGSPFLENIEEDHLDGKYMLGKYHQEEDLEWVKSEIRDE